MMTPWTCPDCGSQCRLYGDVEKEKGFHQRTCSKFPISVVTERRVDQTFERYFFPCETERATGPGRRLRR
jgi:hypothetical protein